MRKLLIFLTLLFAVNAEATVDNAVSRNNYVGNNSTKAFPYTFRILAANELRVVVNGVSKVLNTDYSVSGVGSQTGGTVTFVTAPPTGAPVVFVRSIPIVQNTDYIPNQAINANTLETNFDRLTMIAQMLEQAIIDRNLDQVVGLTGSGTPGRLAYWATASALSSINLATDANNNSLIMPAGVYVPGVGCPQWKVLTIGSTAISADNGALRRATWCFFDTKTDDVNNVLIDLNVISRTNPGGGQIGKTGLRIVQYSLPDNGGDTSGALIYQTGGGNGLSVYKLVGLRPAGYTSYHDSDSYALEVGSDSNFYAQGVFVGRPTTGQPDGGVKPGGILINIQNSNGGNEGGKGILVNPQNGAFDTRQAYAVGTPVSGNVDVNIQYQVLMNGNVGLGRLAAADPSIKLVLFDVHNTASGVNIALVGNGATTPNKFIRSANGIFEIVNNDYSTTLFSLTDSGAPRFPVVGAAPVGSKAACFDATGILFRSATGVCP